MPRRDARFRIEDMRDAVARILTYAAGLSFDEFAADQKTVDAVVRNFEVLGEAARHVDDATQRLAPGIPWLEVRDMRNLLAHEYFGVDLETLWKTVADDLPDLLLQVEELLRKLP